MAFDVSHATETDLDGYFPIFVYGTLRPAQSNYYRMAAYAIRSEPAHVTGYALYDLEPVTGNSWPHAVRTNNPEHSIVGDIVWIDPTHAAEVLNELDVYEDYDPNDLPNSEYIRVKALTTETRTGDQRLAWMYVANMHMVDLASEEHRIEHGDWTKR